VQAAAAAGFKAMEAGGSALDAVEAAVRSMEDDPAFDAGRGSVLTEDGLIEMDSVIVDGKDLSFGAVASVNNIQNAVSLARKVMENTDHCMLVGAGATKFARDQGVPVLPTEALVTEEARELHEKFKKYSKATDSLFNNQEAHDTVGAVAIDADGNIAAATSTGGIPMKMAGRVGDSPLIGCGASADNLLGGASTTGHGESIMKVQLAAQVLRNANDCSGAEAVQAGLDLMRKRTGGCGGVILIDRAGEPAFGFSTKKMPWAIERSGQEPACGIMPGDDRGRFSAQMN
jgi:beta-aspartyl-peptidase (threonine type)